MARGRVKKYIIGGDPKPLKRVRFGNRRAYDKQKPTKMKDKRKLKEQHQGPLFTGPLSIDIVFFMPIPLSYSDKKQDELLYCYHHCRPDASNLLKYVEDVGNNVLWLDDSLFCEITCRKIYEDCVESRTEFTVRELVVYDPKEEFCSNGKED